MDVWHSTSFGIYAIFATGLCLMLMSIDGASGASRAKTKTAVNAEDKAFAKDLQIVPDDPEPVARVMRAHRNALANVIPFLAVMFLFVALGASSTWVLALCGVFSFARLVHVFAYVGAKQPFRTLSFLVGQICTVIAAVQVIRVAFTIAM